ncbi:MAG: CPCC family cysteine-rich protein [Thiotrichales bacterium]
MPPDCERLRMINRFPCPCCGYLVFEREPGSHQVCPICYWEDNLVQLRFPLMAGAANHVSLLEGQRNFAACGAAESRHAGETRSPFGHEGRDAGWRPLEPARDNPEEPRRGIKYADTYPERDPTVMYYWRATYWRRLSS